MRHYVKPNFYNLEKCDLQKFNFMVYKIVKTSVGSKPTFWRAKPSFFRGHVRAGATGAWHPQNFEKLPNKTSPKLEPY